MSAPTVRFAETPAQYLARVYQPGPVRSSTQQAFTLYFGLGIGSLAAGIVWYHSLRLRTFFGHYPTRFIVPSAVAVSLFADKWVSAYSRRSHQGMDRYDRDWRSMPVGDV